MLFMQGSFEPSSNLGVNCLELELRMPSNRRRQKSARSDDRKRRGRQRKRKREPKVVEKKTKSHTRNIYGKVSDKVHIEVRLAVGCQAYKAARRKATNGGENEKHQ